MTALRVPASAGPCRTSPSTPHPSAPIASAAKNLLEQGGDFQEIDVSCDPSAGARDDEAGRRPAHRAADLHRRRHIGGCDDSSPWNGRRARSAAGRLSAMSFSECHARSAAAVQMRAGRRSRRRTSPRGVPLMREAAGEGGAALSPRRRGPTSCSATAARCSTRSRRRTIPPSPRLRALARGARRLAADRLAGRRATARPPTAPS